MAKLVWKELKPDDMAVVTDYLVGLPEAERPLYGLQGIKTTLWSQLGGGGATWVVLFMPDRIVLSKRSKFGNKDKGTVEHPLSDLMDLSVRDGPMFDSALFTFKSGFKMRVGNIPNTQIEPVKRFLEIGVEAFEWSGLTNVQRTNACVAFSMMGILPPDLL